jgi:beta-lactam-binding protein with PASTA domain
MALQTRVWGASKFLLIGLALITTYLLFAVAAARIALRAREVAVPDLKGQTVSAANASLASLDLSLRVDDAKRLDPGVPTDSIVAQDIPPGTTARRGRSVRVWLSAGARAAAVPRLQGESERMARLRLEQDGLEVGTVSEMRSNDEASGVVVAQEPAPGKSGARVSMLVAPRPM